MVVGQRLEIEGSCQESGGGYSATVRKVELEMEAEVAKSEHGAELWTTACTKE